MTRMEWVRVFLIIGHVRVRRYQDGVASVRERSSNSTIRNLMDQCCSGCSAQVHKRGVSSRAMWPARAHVHVACVELRLAGRTRRSWCRSTCGRHIGIAAARRSIASATATGGTAVGRAVVGVPIWPQTSKSNRSAPPSDPATPGDHGHAEGRRAHIRTGHRSAAARAQTTGPPIHRRQSRSLPSPRPQRAVRVAQRGARRTWLTVIVYTWPSAGSNNTPHGRVASRPAGHDQDATIAATAA